MNRISRRRILSLIGAVPLLPALAKPGAGNGHGTIHDVEIRGFVFQPDTLAVSRGDRIRWINQDIVPHTATALDESWDTGLLNKAESAEIVVTGDMATEYFCQFHPNMQASLTIKT